MLLLENIGKEKEINIRYYYIFTFIKIIVKYNKKFMRNDKLITYLNKQVYDSEAYEKLSVINTVRKILKKYNIESEESNKQFSKIYSRN